MKTLIGVGLAATLAAGLLTAGRAADGGDPDAVVDKAIAAVGGADRLEKAKGFSWTATGKITFGGADNPVTQRYVIQDLDHSRQEFQGEFGGMAIRGVTVLSGDKGWRSFMGGVNELDKDQLANEKRLTYLSLIPVTPATLNNGKFKLESVADEKVNDRPAAGVKVIPQDGKEFRLYFDKETGLPARLVARVLDFMGEEFTQETTFSDYKRVDGVQRATRVQSKRDGQNFLDHQISDFKVLDEVDAKSFERPK